MTSKSTPSVNIDFRSDTLTNPSPEMRRVMAEAVVGDDVWGLDPTVVELEEYIAKVVGKEKALFVPSGTMSNLIATTVHCEGLFSEVIMGKDSHTALYEVGNSTLARAHSRQLPNNADGTIDLQAIEANIQEADIHNTVTRVIFLEQTHCAKGGKVLPMDYIWSVRKIADARGVKMHCDGARIWNAATALGCPVAEVAKPFDTVSVCMSKGLGAPMGSLLCGPAPFISKALHARKMYGGGMRQVGIVAAGALYAAQHMFGRLSEDHRWCRELAAGLQDMGFKTEKPQTNMVLWDVEAAKRSTFVEECERRGLFVCPMGPYGTIRAVPHFGNSDEDISTAIKIMREVKSLFSISS